MTDSEYLNWIFDSYWKPNYKFLFEALLEYSFIPDMKNHPLDESRNMYGIDLRSAYEYETGGTCDIFGEASFLEMLVGLAKQLENQILWDMVNDRTGEWVWMMLDNMGLSYFDDVHFNKLKVFHMIEDFNNHKYEANGKGGLFYVEDPPAPMNETDIWVQANWWSNTIE